MGISRIMLQQVNFSRNFTEQKVEIFRNLPYRKWNFPKICCGKWRFPEMCYRRWNFPEIYNTRWKSPEICWWQVELSWNLTEQKVKLSRNRGTFQKSYWTESGNFQKSVVASGDFPKLIMLGGNIYRK